MEWEDVIRLIDELIEFYEDKLENGHWMHQDIWESAIREAVKKRQAVVAKIEAQSA